MYVSRFVLTTPPMSCSYRVNSVRLVGIPCGCTTAALTPSVLYGEVRYGLLVRDTQIYTSIDQTLPLVLGRSPDRMTRPSNCTGLPGDVAQAEHEVGGL